MYTMIRTQQLSAGFRFRFSGYVFGHIARMDDDADAKMILMAPLQRTGRDHQGVPV